MGHGQGHVTQLNFGAPNVISGTAEARIVKCCTQIEWNTNHPKKGRDHGYMTHCLSVPAIISPNGRSESRQIFYAGRIYQMLAWDDRLPPMGLVRVM